MIVTRQPYRALVQWTAAVLLVIGATLPAQAQSTVIYDTIIDDIPPEGGLPIIGTVFGQAQDIAIPFTTDSNSYLLTSVSVPMGPSATPTILLQILTDNGGLPATGPSAVLDSLFTSESGPPGFRINWSPNNVTLLPNTTYWLAALAGTPDTFRVWEDNNVGQIGLAANQGNGWFIAPPRASPGARIIGVGLSAAAPEPGSVCLLGLTLIGTGLAQRPRRRRP